MDNQSLYFVEYTNNENTDPVSGLEFSEFVTFWADSVDHVYEQLDDVISDAKIIQVYLCNPLLPEIKV